MGVLATGRSQLTNQVVQVQRRRTVRDQMGGVSERFETIVPRYWVRLLPYQHSERERIEPGEQAVDGSHVALGARTLNGMTVMVGDRFYDEANNELYHVKGVRRPIAISSYNVGMVRYKLQIIKDVPCPSVGVDASLPASLPVTSSGGNGGGVDTGETHLILRHFEVVDMANIESGAVDYGSYDGFVYDHVGIQEDVVQSLIVQGKRAFRYYEVMTFPPATLHDPWWDWWRAQGQVLWKVGLVNGSDDPGVFRYSGAGCLDQQFVDWSLIGAGERQIIADKMFELAPNAGFFLDQAWVKESPDFFFADPASGGAGGCGACAYCATYASIPASKWPDWQASIMAFYALMDEMAADRGQWVLKNGEHRTIGSPSQQTPRPIYYENSADNPLEAPDHFANSVTGWKQHPRNVLSIDVPDAVNLPLMLDEFDQHGGWIAFTGAASSAAVQDAYAQAASIKAAH